MDTVTLLGLVAGALTTFSFIPQLLKVWKSRSSGDVSLAMYGIISVGIALWLVYGVMIDSFPVILTNSITLCIALMILGLKIRFK